MRAILMGAVFAALGSSECLSQSISAEGVLERIEELEQEIERLREFQTPRNAIMAFDQAECPSGWEDFHHARDRFILGAGAKYSVGATGGAETHRLTVEEMPSHDHGGIWGGDGGKAGMNNDYAYHSAGHLRIASQGGGRPHNNMPPYIALRWCKKI